MAGAGSSRISPPVAVAIALPLLLALVVAGLGLYSRVSAGPDTGPLALPPQAAPQASTPQCDAVLGALPAQLPADPAALGPRELDPAVPGARAWIAEPGPVVLRCGTERPAELGPTSPLIVVNGVDWLPLATPDGALTTTYAAVDRGVYLELSAAAEAGPGPLQAVADAITGTLPAEPVRVR
ncbi:hypothetical protein Ae168Ps1_4784c [Pseudonocardia sp. Ae168_Ps1]|uniref:DUF3515 domain-containing protein n=1 Tax=unclassified Pseudonocardia TaxID=2619320 RepID=UPI00095C53DD|nr:MULTISPECIES: DUF3515 domain-containing protein [unclassified Pseudonocardia]OLL76368.1 hypothetical protein Ae150APs1_4746c [Pseudonocardia sp. Ae150A_Ps1]OLL82378.1 hypothetical protein Ae168Ps1_4784c [Pseudonocardia sp. Ae168_Ps1]OLL83507.1 hypothetical protein Ae263Ps1_0562 [Pseudonocardia sp. Ae263_Ps1]OLL90454.1 hypothetical protein Ae356Ps1_0351c [Pseudonocardia sp. Ae356_Ps1]